MMHHDSITGTSGAAVMGDFNDRAKRTNARVLDMNSKLIAEKVQQLTGIKSQEMQGTLDYWQTWTTLTTPFSHFNELLFVV
jgi:hypothetical protein